MADGRFPNPILRTKLHRPRVTPDLVCRGRLHELLDGALTRPLALVSAPAGYGKSMLVSQWAESLEEPCAWLSLDDTEGDRVGFASYLLAAVQTLFPQACPESASMLRASEPVPPETIAGSLVNELESLETPFVLVLDDYHRIGSSSEVHDLLRRLLEHPPLPLHLVVVTRRDPPLGLESLRAADDLTEVRLDDLRFSVPETATLLHALAGQALSDEELAALDGRIEGWAVGLRLAALALRDAADPAQLLQDLRSGTQHADAYLAQQVVEHLPPEMRDWMLRTSVLDRFCPSLCQAVCSPGARSQESTFDGESFVHALQEANLFCISLDSRGEWFRYHHLFQGFLQDELRRRFGQEIPELHTLASAWFEAQGLIEESIRQAQQAGDDELASQLVEKHRMRAITDDSGPV
jgi:LuxR family maltose regulon positive regulatory protein